MGKFRLQHSPTIVVAPAIGSSVLGSDQHVKWIAVALCSAAAVYLAASLFPQPGLLMVHDMSYEIRVAWDSEASVWYIEDSNVPGLVGEALSLEAKVTLLQTRVPEMLEENGCPRDDDIPLRLLTTGHLAQLRVAA